MSLASYQAAPPRDSVVISSQKSDSAESSQKLLGVESHEFISRARDAAYYRRTGRLPVTFFRNLSGSHEWLIFGGTRVSEVRRGQFSFRGPHLLCLRPDVCKAMSEGSGVVSRGHPEEHFPGFIDSHVKAQVQLVAHRRE